MSDNPLISILDDRQAISQIDPSGALDSAQSLADQVKQVWDQRQEIQFDPKHSEDIDRVVVAGMGGSSLGGDVIVSLFKDILPVPVTLNRDYQLPNFVDDETLVILSSYSGNTEEVLACAQIAENKGAQIAVISAGGELIELAKEKNWPHFFIDAKYNPSNQPRMAIGYSVMAFITMLMAADLLSVTEEQFISIIDVINQVSEDNRIEVPQDKNQAKILAYLCLERRPILIGAEFLEGALHVATNQFNENAKIFADYKVLPELNHHLLEGLTFPKSNPLDHFFIFFQSTLYHERNQKRLELTKELLEQKDLDNIIVHLQSDSKITQVFELITLMSFTNLYLAYLEKIDPCPIPNVDWFKAQLK